MTSILLTVFFILMLASCSENNGIDTNQNGDSLFKQYVPQKMHKNRQRKPTLSFFKGMCCTSGIDVRDAFYQAISNKSSASILCAHYYVLDKEHMSAELYESEKDQYPKLLFYLVEFDGEKYTVKTRESTVEAIDYQETFQYLLHFTGTAPVTATYSSYDNYVPVDDPSATREGIMAGLFSSQAGAGYKHCKVYQNIFD